MFNQKTWTIYQPKESYGDSPNSPQSPRQDIAVSGHDTVKQLGYMATVGLVAQSTINLARTEIGATTGNEVLESNINNLMLGLGYATLIVKTGFVGVGGLIIKGTFDAIKNQREFNRENQAIDFNRKLLGNRVSIAGGNIYD